MADKILNVKIKQRYDAEHNWKSKDPVLLAGEMAISSDKNGMYKVGNGSSKWSELSYSYMNSVVLPSSSDTNKGKFVKFATVDLSNQRAYGICSGVLLFNHEEGTAGAKGTLFFHIRNGSTAGVIVQCTLNWLSINSSIYSNSIFAVKVNDGKYDFYYKPMNDWDTPSVCAICVDNPKLLSFKNGSFIDSITPVTTSSVSSYSSYAQTANTANTANSVKWSNVSGKPDTYKPSAHDHTETEVDAMLNKLSTGTAEPTDNDYYISQYAGGGTTTTTYHRRPISALLNYIKGKLAKVASSGSYNDLSDKPVTGTSSYSGTTKLYTETGNNTDGTMTQSAIKTELGNKVDKVSGKDLSTNDYTTAEKNKLKGIAAGATANTGTITGVKMNGSSKGTSGVVDLGTVLTGGKQTSTSNADSGSNVYTFSDGSTITVKNGSKGSTGSQGPQGEKGATGPQGEKGATGATGPAGTSVTVSNVSESTASGGSNVVTFSDGKKVTIKNGINGTNGSNGITPTIKAASGTSIGSVGTPTVTASTSGTTTTFTFNNLKGQKGDKGDPGVNATTTSVATTSANGLMSSAMVSKLNELNETFLITAEEPSSTKQQDGDIWFECTVIKNDIT